jgi:predicted secreted hydrolase
MKRWLICLLAILGLTVTGLIWQQSRQTSAVQSSLIVNTGLPVDDDFSRVLGVQPLNFPQDHGPHPDYQTEWWYFTGNLQAEDGRRFGYQLTFFRRAIQSPKNSPERDSRWATNQVYMAHFALADISNQEYRAFERIARGAVGLSGAQAAPFRVWLEDWWVEETGRNLLDLPSYHLQAAQDGIKLDLSLDDQKGPILQGDQGFSRKGPEAGQASAYYSLTRLNSEGMLSIGEELFAVRGASWMDHEYSTSVLTAEQVGWDWFSFQFDDNSELMVFQIRKADGSVNPFSSGAWISPQGAVTPLTQQNFNITVTKTWQSPHSKAVYPAEWEINIPTLDLQLKVEPYIADQELNLSYSYWEGAVKINGQRAGQPIQGSGYVELTGYSSSMGGEF